MPLSGIKVVEACSNIAVPATGTIFGDLGADVIKIETPNGGEDARGWAPPMLAGMAARFQVINRNKRSVTLDLKKSDDRAGLKKQISDSDVFSQHASWSSRIAGPFRPRRARATSAARPTKRLSAAGSPTSSVSHKPRMDG
jgi:hypothetical protein